jgi:hypothetical protein
MEFLSLHVDLAGRRAVPYAPDDAARIARFAAAHAHLPVPAGAGRAVGAKR